MAVQPVFVKILISTDFIFVPDPPFSVFNRNCGAIVFFGKGEGLAPLVLHRSCVSTGIVNKFTPLVQMPLVVPRANGVGFSVDSFCMSTGPGDCVDTSVGNRCGVS